MTCPNGHTGGVFCCEDHVNQCFDTFVKRYGESHGHGEPLIPVTLDQWEAYQRILKEQEDGKGRLEEADEQGQV